MTSDADDRVLAVEAQFDRIIDPTIRTYGVPNAAEVHLNLARKRILERVFGLEGRLLPHRALRHLCVEAQNVGDQLLVAGFQQSIHMQQAANSARRIGSAAETEQEDPVAILVCIHQVAVGIPHIFQQSSAEGETLQLRPFLSQGPNGIGRSKGADTRMVIGNLGRANEECVVQLDDV